MRKLLKSALLLALLVQTASADGNVRVHRYSAMRMKGEPARNAFARYMNRLGPYERSFVSRQGQETAMGAAKPLTELDPTSLPDFGQNKSSVSAAFERIRDMRFLEDPERQGFMRRSSWMYPDDGCFARAALMVKNLPQRHPRPGKVFIFGNLTVKTPNSPEGEVSWWYHVVPGFRMGKDVVVLDPAIDPYKPLFLQEWVATMTNDPSSVTLSFCEPDTYVPSSSCRTPTSQEKEARSTQVGYLRDERERLQNMNRDADRELGDFPPWLNPSEYRRRH